MKYIYKSSPLGLPDKNPFTFSFHHCFLYKLKTLSAKFATFQRISVHKDGKSQPFLLKAVPQKKKENGHTPHQQKFFNSLCISIKLYLCSMFKLQWLFTWLISVPLENVSQLFLEVSKEVIMCANPRLSSVTTSGLPLLSYFCFSPAHKPQGILPYHISS